MATLDITKISVAAFLKKSNKGSAKRCLFGPVNHEENTRLLREQLACQEKESMEKWNFDFRNETPVCGGRFNWVKVDSPVDQENTVPVAYALPQISSSPAKSRVFSPLTFSSRVNRQQKKEDSCSVEKKLDLSASCDNVVNVPTSPASNRKPPTTVPVLKKFRDETPTVQELSAQCTRVSDQITPEGAESSINQSASSSGSSQQSTSPTSSKSPCKRKLAQAEITEFFPMKKSRTATINSAKRRLEL